MLLSTGSGSLSTFSSESRLGSRMLATVAFCGAVLACSAGDPVTAKPAAKLAAAKPATQDEPAPAVDASIPSTEVERLAKTLPRGQLQKEAIRRVIHRRMGEIAACWKS